MAEHSMCQPGNPSLLIPPVTQQMARQFAQATYSVLHNAKDVESLLADRVREPLSPGQLLLVLTDRVHKVLAIHRYDGFDKLAIRDVTMRTTASNANLCAIIERVDDCMDIPSPDRLQAINELAAKLDAQMSPLWDYYTVDGLGSPPRSYANSGLLLPRSVQIRRKKGVDKQNRNGYNNEVPLSRGHMRMCWNW